MMLHKKAVLCHNHRDIIVLQDSVTKKICVTD